MPLSYTYDRRSRRYRNSDNGQYVTPAQVRAAVDTVIDTETANIRALSERLVSGDIRLAEWQMQMASRLKTLHVAMGVAASGGFAQTSPADYGYIGSLIKKQYQFLRDFADQIAGGKQALDGSLVSRSALYAQSGRAVFEDMVGRQAQESGVTQEMSVLGAADHCDDCTSEAAKGWQPVGTLIPIGERQCKGNCRCSMQYR